MPSLPCRLFAAALWFCGATAAEVRSLTILHLNDMHSRLMPLENKHGGFAYLASVIRRERTNCKDCVLLNAGDLAQGTPVSTIFHGLPIFEIANLLGIDAATLGNHDFDYAWPQTRKFMTTAKYPIVSANIVGAQGQLFTKEPYTILNVNGLRVAVLGAMTHTLDTLTTPQLVEEWHALPVAETVRKYARELKAKSDIVVLVAHITGEEELDVLSNVPEIPVTVSGHLHNGLPQALNQDGRVLVRVRGYAEELGRLELKVDTEKKAPVSWTWKKIPVDSTAIAPAEDVAREVKHWEDQASARVDRPMATAKREFTKAEVRRLIEQAMRTETGADFAFMNQGGVRDILPAGQLLERHIWNIMPFDNRVVTGTFKGKDLPEVVLNGRTVEPERKYTLAVSDFTAANQGINDSLRVTGLKFPADAGLMRDMLIDWFKKKKVIE
jgi:2',3'-cyclic-nucleotide 2'-phosphodiesterase (5'-nucleotidase family)